MVTVSAASPGSAPSLSPAFVARPDPRGSAPAESVDGPGARYHFTAVPEPLGNKIFLPGIDWNASAINNKGVAALDHDHVFVILVHVRRGMRCLATSPKRHLAPVHTV